MYEKKEPYQREENKGWFTNALPPRPTVVCLLGSTRFKKHFELLNRDETLDGKIVLMPGHFTHAEAPGEGAPGDKEAYFGAEQAAALDELYRRKIELADEVLVVNPGNYVGDSTRREIAYALELGKVVRWLEPPTTPVPAAAVEAQGYDRKTPENAAALTAAFLRWHDVDPERLAIRDVMTLAAEDGEPAQLQFQATVKGLTDWYSFALDAQGNPDPASIKPLPF